LAQNFRNIKMNKLNNKRTYEIFIVESGKVIDTCRLKATIQNVMPKLKETIRKELGVRKVEVLPLE